MEIHLELKVGHQTRMALSLKDRLQKMLSQDSENWIVVN